MGTERPVSPGSDLGLVPKTPRKQGWLARLFRRPDVEGALDAVETALATEPWDGLSPQGIASILSSRRVTREQAWDSVLGIYGRAISASLSDDGLTEEAQSQLDRLGALLGIPESLVTAERQVALEGKFRKALEAAVADRWLSDDEKKALDQLGSKLGVPDDRVNSVRREVLGKLVQAEFDRATEDHRFSPEEDEHLVNLAENLGVKHSYDDRTKDLLERYKLLWRISQGEVPAILAPIRLQRGEDCHWCSPASLHEQRTVTRRIGYSGPTARVRIAKGVYWRMGNLGVSRTTEDVLKLLDQGTLYLTNKRLLFDGANKTTNVTLKRIINFTVYSDGLRIEKDSGKDQVYQFDNTDPELLGAILDATLGRG